MGGRIALQCFFDLIVGTRYEDILFSLRIWVAQLLGTVQEVSSHLVLVQKIGRLKNVLVISKNYAKKHSHVVLVVIPPVLDGLSISKSPWEILWDPLSWLISNNESYNHSKYETQPLEEALIGAFSDKEHLFGGSRPNESFGSDIKVAVTTTSAAGSPVILSNYNRICGEKRGSKLALIKHFKGLQ